MSRRNRETRAYMAHNGEPGELAWVILATTARQARRLAFGLDGLDEYLEIRAHLIRDNNGKPVPLPPGRNGIGTVDFPRPSQPDLAEWFRDIGWWSEDPSRHCGDCGLHEWPQLSDTVVCGRCGLCGRCGEVDNDGCRYCRDVDVALNGEVDNG